MSIAVNENRCPQNHRCPAIAVCPFGALTQDGYGVPKVDEEKCTSCGKCAKRCPMGALAIKK
jgi:Fe-S-cluster-containing hydrogenase component 2